MSSAFSVTVAPDWKLNPGTTSCVDCGAVLATPNNIIPHEFAAAHSGHTIHTRLAPTIPDLERAVIEAAIEWGTGDDQGLYEKARTLQDAVNALYLARKGEL